MQRSQVHSRESDGVPDLGIAQWHEVGHEDGKFTDEL